MKGSAQDPQPTGHSQEVAERVLTQEVSVRNSWVSGGGGGRRDGGEPGTSETDAEEREAEPLGACEAPSEPRSGKQSPREPGQSRDGGSGDLGVCAEASSRRGCQVRADSRARV